MRTRGEILGLPTETPADLALVRVLCLCRVLEREGPARDEIAAAWRRHRGERL